MGIISDLLYKFFYSRNPKRLARYQKKRQLKIIAYGISHNTFKKFYSPRRKYVNSSFGDFFLKIYKTIAATRSALEKAEQSDVLKTITVETFISTDQSFFLSDIDEAAIMKLSEDLSIEELRKEVEKRIHKVAKSFNSEWCNNVDKTYNKILAVIWFVEFDFYRLLRKIVPLNEHELFLYDRGMPSADAAHLTEDIRDFLSIANVTLLHGDWTVALDILRLYKQNVSLLSNKEWTALVYNVQRVLKSNILTLIVEHCLSTVTFEFNVLSPKERISMDYLNQKIDQARGCVRKAMEVNHKSRIDELAADLFGAINGTSLALNYTREYSNSFKQNSNVGFIYTEAFNFTITFHYQYLEKIKKLCNIFIIRGVWQQPGFYKRFSNDFNNLLPLSEKLMRFDQSLDEHESLGRKLSSLSSHAHGRIESYLTSLNNEARTIIEENIEAIATLNRSLKQLVEDRIAESHDIIKNWNELSGELDHLSMSSEILSEKTDSFIYLINLLLNNSNANPDENEGTASLESASAGKPV